MRVLSDGLSRCGSCGAPVRWLRNVTTGKLAPINAAPDGNGNIEIGADTYRVVTKVERVTPGVRYTNHFSDCPQAHSWHGMGRAG